MVAANDFSLFALFTAGLAALVRADEGPTANAVRLPGLGDIIPAGERYDIKWDAATPYAGGTVTLILLKGPSTNAVPIQTIVAGTENDGSYEWYPAADLEDSNGDTGYGIKLVIDANGAYQYTTQFGISNTKKAASSSAAASSAAASSAASVKVESVAASSAVASSAAASVVTPTASGNASYVTEIVTAYTTFCPYATELTHNGKTYTVTKPTTLTITDCPGGCTVTKPVYTSVVTDCKSCSASASASVSAPVPTSSSVQGVVGNPNPPYGTMSNTTVSYSKPALGSSTTGAAGTPASTPSNPLYTGAAGVLKASGVFGAAAAMGAAFFAL
ncbi:putative gpi anchored serine-threonine rich protein [Diplodia seriata]|uniref:Putative gpi anchored serine-threonine rich protein n=1 Tax=Diplodia seriata TaxID=420778 RepID=A0A0G2EAZ2_9PEZI|nr:putative gpi anchored serine-threonine rich protein [Diplodia seriata]